VTGAAGTVAVAWGAVNGESRGASTAGATAGAKIGAKGAVTTARISIAEIVTLSLLADMAIVKVGPVVVTVNVVVYAVSLPPIRPTKSILTIFVPATVTSKTRDPLVAQLCNDETII
jgi:hypothetical protein